MTKTEKKRHWLVRMNHRMRTVSFTMLFIATSLHLWNKHYNAIDWLLLGALFLVYPHLQYWRVLRSKNPVQAEMNNMLADVVLLSLCVAALGFPLWITFSALLAAGNIAFWRNGQPLALILVDVDHFKRLNDTYGHQAGDKVLIRLGPILGGMARAGDVACRHGGKSFWCCCPPCP